MPLACLNFLGIYYLVLESSPNVVLVLVSITGPTLSEEGSRFFSLKNVLQYHAMSAKAFLWIDVLIIFFLLLDSVPHLLIA